MLRQTRVKLFAFHCGLAIACIGMAGNGYSMSPNQNVPQNGNALPLPLTGPAVAPNVPGTAPFPNQAFPSCQQTLQSILNAYDNNDADTIQSLLYYSPDADAQYVRLISSWIQLDLAAYRLQKAALSRYGFRAVVIQTHWDTGIAIYTEFLARMNSNSFTSTPSDLTVPSDKAVSRLGDWHNAPIYFHCDNNGVWKFDIGRTEKITFQATRSNPVDGEAEEQTWIAGEQVYFDGINTITQRINQGQIADTAEVQKEIDDLVSTVSDQFPVLIAKSQPN